MQPGEKFVRCLLDQQNEEHLRARRQRRRTLLISILIQVLVLTLLLLRPLFGAQEVPLVARWLPLPPYRGKPGAPPRTSRGNPPAASHLLVIAPHSICRCAPQRPSHFGESVAPDIGPSLMDSGGEGPGDPNGLIPVPGITGGANLRPDPPAPGERTQKGPRRVPSEIQEASLLERVEPRYPPLASRGDRPNMWRT